MKRIVWKNKSNSQLCVTIPSKSGIDEGDIIDLSKSSIKKISYIGVVGDLFHYGHLNSIQFAKSISDLNIMGILTDKAVEEYRTKPISNLKERKAVISSLNCVDRVMVQHSRDPTENLKRIHEEFPDAEIILVHGSDLNYVHGSEYVKSINGSIVQHPYYDRLSNYKIINQLMENKDKFKDITDFASLISGKKELDSEYEKGNKIIISTKANTLKVLKPILKNSRIEDIYVFTVPDWKNKKQKIIKEIQEKFSGKIVVRSSAVNEDTLDNSMAGFFESILSVDSGNENEIESAVKKVYSTYKDKGFESSFNQILVQKQTEDIVSCGVLFTRSLEQAAPYYVINYDDSTGETDTVTRGVEDKTLKISHFAKDVPDNMKDLIKAVKEIEELVPGMGLDIEFAIKKNKEIVIFQVRPLTLSFKAAKDDDKVEERLKSLKKEVTNLSTKKEQLSGVKTILADMPDWNPAEIIGDQPNYLDYSLYDYIITDNAWHEARTSQGYYNVNPAKLVILVGNKPYIDVRNSFNSFIPASLSQELRTKLVDFYLNKLEKNPEMQDKVEFEVLYTCYDLNFDDRSKELLDSGFSEKEINELKDSLIKLTNNLVIGSKETIKEDLDKLKELETNREKVKQPSDSIDELRYKAKFLLEDCREKGTVQFSRLARLGFIGKILLKSLGGIIDNEFYDSFMNSISTVATGINEDFKLMSSGKINKEDFVKKYYHLRPGSYDITSQRYESNPSLIKKIDSEVVVKCSDNFCLDKSTEENISKTLSEQGLKFNAKDLLEFVRAALEAREYSKFEFTKNLSDAIELIAISGEKIGFNRKELAMLSVQELFTKVEDNEELITLWKNAIETRTKERILNNKIIMPPIIFSHEDLDVVQYYSPKPNYITQKKAQGELIKLDSNDKDIEGKIVLIENGDPGYDWIFTRNIAGLITKYGGVASHMSIRCAEFGIPAAIGCGMIYDKLLNANTVILDCGSKKIMGGE
jgi:glutamine kinase